MFTTYSTSRRQTSVGTQNGPARSQLLASVKDSLDAARALEAVVRQRPASARAHIAVERQRVLRELLAQRATYVAINADAPAGALDVLGDLLERLQRATSWLRKLA